MTGREYLHAKTGLRERLPLLLVLVSFPVFVALAAGEVRPELICVFLLLVVTGLVASFCMIRQSMRCPSCGGSLAPLASYNHIPVVRLPKKVTHCPLCGFRFDEEMGTDAPKLGSARSQQADERR